MFAVNDVPVPDRLFSKTVVSPQKLCRGAESLQEMGLIDFKGESSEVVPVLGPAGIDLTGQNIVNIHDRDLESAKGAQGLDPTFPALWKIARLEVGGLDPVLTRQLGDQLALLTDL